MRCYIPNALLLYCDLSSVNKMHSLKKRVGNDGQKIALTGVVHSKHLEETAIRHTTESCMFVLKRDCVARSRALSRTVVVQVRMINRTCSEALE